MSNYSGNAINNIVSIKPNGDYDNTFLPPTNWINSGNTVYGNMYVQNDGRVIVAAPLYIAGTKNLIRFNTDGSIDSTFRQAPSNLNVYCIERYDDNRLVFGNSTQYNGYTVNGIMRVYNNDISNEVKLLTNSPAFLVYPNPVQSNLYINSADLIGMEISVKIYNVLGDLVMTKENLSMHSGDAVINVSSLSSGLFFLSINCGQKTITSKFQKFD